MASGPWPVQVFISLKQASLGLLLTPLCSGDQFATAYHTPIWCLEPLTQRAKRRARFLSPIPKDELYGPLSVELCCGKEQEQQPHGVHHRIVVVGAREHAIIESELLCGQAMAVRPTLPLVSRTTTLPKSPIWYQVTFSVKQTRVSRMMRSTISAFKVEPFPQTEQSTQQDRGIVRA